MRGRTLTRILLVILVISVLLCGAAFALMFRQSELLQNQFEAARVDCVVHEELDNSGDYTSGKQYAEEKTGIKVQNTGNIDAYIRIRFVTYWQDVNGNIVGKESQKPTISVTEDWVQVDSDTYCYKRPVAPGGFTEELLSSPIILGMDEGYVQVVEVFADAIQSLPKTAAEQSWKVTITGKEITGVN